MARKASPTPDLKKMRREVWPISKFVPYPNNPRTHPAAQVTLLAELLKKYGPDQDIVVSGDDSDFGSILKGHGRRLAALEAGMTHFPVTIRIDLSDVDKRMMRIEDNQVALLSGWDATLMHGEMISLKDAGYDTMKMFPEIQLRGWGISAGNNDVQDPDQVPERPKKPIVRIGDLWVLGDHRLLCGDSTDAKDVEEVLDGAKPHLSVTDPPYGVSYDPSWRADANKWKGSMVKRGAKAMGVVKNDTIADWQKSWELVPSLDVIYSWSSSLYAIEAARGLQGAGFVLRCQIVWDKMRLVIGRGDYNWQHEPCWYAVRKGKTGHWQGSRPNIVLYGPMELG